MVLADEPHKSAMIVPERVIVREWGKTSSAEHIPIPVMAIFLVNLSPELKEQGRQSLAEE
jgi:hypothetical protein